MRKILIMRIRKKVLLNYKNVKYVKHQELIKKTLIFMIRCIISSKSKRKKLDKFKEEEKVKKKVMKNVKEAMC